MERRMGRECALEKYRLLRAAISTIVRRNYHLKKFRWTRGSLLCVRTRRDLGRGALSGT